MVKLVGDPEKARRQSIRGRAYVRVVNGRAILSKWPVRRPGPMSEKQQFAVDKFRQAAVATKYMDSVDQAEARRLTKGTNALPRDLLMQALYGRLGVVILNTGERFYSVASLINVREFLDIMGKKAGSISYRDKDYWVVLEPGDANDVLTIGPDNVPIWQPGGAGIGAPWAHTTHASGYSSSSYATKGYYFSPAYNMNIDKVGVYLHGGSADETYIAGVYKMDGTTVDQVLSKSAEFTLVSGGDQMLPIELDNVAQLLAGNTYVIAATRTDGDGTASLDIWNLTGYVGPPLAEDSTNAYAADNDIQVGDTINTNSSTYYQLGFAYGM